MFNSLYSSYSDNIVNENISPIFVIIDKIFLVKEIWKSMEGSLYLSYENDKTYKVMNFPPEAELLKEYINILNEGYEELSKILDSTDKYKHIQELTKEQAINAIDWIERLFIDEFEKQEEYEKCSRLKELVIEIKLIKQI